MHELCMTVHTSAFSTYCGDQRQNFPCIILYTNIIIILTFFVHRACVSSCLQFEKKTFFSLTNVMRKEKTIMPC